MLNRTYTYKVSVCLLTYNHGHLIGRVIDSILCQTFSDYELIISDDCSDDDSWDIIKSYSARYPKIQAIRTSSNIGMAGNLNYAASFAKGKYLAILHHDDILSDCLIERWVATGEKTGAGFVFNSYPITNVRMRNRYTRAFTEKMDGKRFLINHLLKNWGCPVRGTALIRHECFKAVSGADMRFGMLADVDLWMKLAARWDVGYVPMPLIEVFQDRPKNYPAEYTRFSWTRTVILFNIHANNITRNLFGSTLAFASYWFHFRLRVSFEVVKWLIYAVAKGDRNMIISAQESKTPYELFIVDFFRRLIRFLYLGIKTNSHAIL